MKVPWNKGKRGLQVAWNKSVKLEKTCLCGALFYVIPSRDTTAKYCSYPCKQKWQVMLNNPAKVLANRAKISAKLVGRSTPWLEGDNSPSKRPEVRAKISELARARWADPNWASGIIVSESWFGKSAQSWKHIELKAAVMTFLVEAGFMVTDEYPVLISGHWYIVDVMATRTNEMLAIECGDCRSQKLEILSTVFHRVIHIPYKSDPVEKLGGVLCAAQ